MHLEDSAFSSASGPLASTQGSQKLGGRNGWVFKCKAFTQQNLPTDKGSNKVYNSLLFGGNLGGFTTWNAQKKNTENNGRNYQPTNCWYSRISAPSVEYHGGYTPPNVSKVRPLKGGWKETIHPFRLWQTRLMASGVIKQISNKVNHSKSFWNWWTAWTFFVGCFLNMLVCDTNTSLEVIIIWSSSIYSIEVLALTNQSSS